MFAFFGEDEAAFCVEVLEVFDCEGFLAFDEDAEVTSRCFINGIEDGAVAAYAVSNEEVSDARARVFYRGCYDMSEGIMC